MKSKKKYSLTKSIVHHMEDRVISQVIDTAVKTAGGVLVSICTDTIRLKEYDAAYANANKVLHRMCPDKYDRNRIPSSNKELYELTEGTTYLFQVSPGNYIRVATKLKDDRTLFTERVLNLEFIGKNRHFHRKEFLMECLRLTDKDHIRTHYLGSKDIVYDIAPHTFDNVIMDKTAKERIIRRLENWKNSREWYTSHQLVYKIGVLLYGKPGVGKSTIARAISSMFDNAPMLIINSADIMDSVSSIIRTRRKQSGTLIVLLEDIDLLFRKRDEISDDECEDGDMPDTVESLDKFYEKEHEKLKKKDSKEDIKLNAIFQLLDGAYSTDDTIYVATTNFREALDDAMVRRGRFDIQEELPYFDEDLAADFTRLLGYDKSVLKALDIEYPVQPALLQSLLMEYRADMM